MLNDETNVKIGTIFKKANILVIIIASIFFVVRAILYVLDSVLPFPISQFSIELISILGSSGILLFGKFYYTNENDEAIIHKKYTFYIQASKYLLIAIIFGYTISSLASFKRIGFDFPPSTIIFVYQIFGLIYLYFQFKKNNININYSFINSDNKSYYLNVLKRILYFLGISIAIYFVCGLIFFFRYRPFFEIISNAIICIIIPICFIIGIGLEYLFLSFLEKIEYDNKGNHLKISYLISGIILVLLFLCLSLVNLAISYISFKEDIPNLESVYIILYNSSTNIEYIIYFFIILTLSFFVPYFYNNKLTTFSIKAYWLFTIIIMLFKLISSTIGLYSLDYNLMMESLTINIINIPLNIISLLLFIIIIYALIKENGFSEKLFIIPIIEIIIYVITIILTTQNDLKILSSFLNSFYPAIRWLIFIIIAYIDSKKLKINGDEYIS